MFFSVSGNGIFVSTRCPMKLSGKLSLKANKQVNKIEHFLIFVSVCISTWKIFVCFIRTQYSYLVTSLSTDQPAETDTEFEYDKYQSCFKQCFGISV